MTWPGSAGFSGYWTSAVKRGSRSGQVCDGPRCVWCDGPLKDSPSDDWCSQDCQMQWLANDGWQAA